MCKKVSAHISFFVRLRYTPPALVGREFNTLSTDRGETWESSHPGTPNHNFSSVIHFFPRHCANNDCREVTTIGRLNTTTHGTAFIAYPARVFSLVRQPNGSDTMTSARISPTTATFKGLPRSIQTGHGLGFGGTTSLMLPAGLDFLFLSCRTVFTELICSLSEQISAVIAFQVSHHEFWEFL